MNDTAAFLAVLRDDVANNRAIPTSSVKWLLDEYDQLSGAQMPMKPAATPEMKPTKPKKKGGRKSK